METRGTRLSESLSLRNIKMQFVAKIDGREAVVEMPIELVADKVKELTRKVDRQGLAAHLAVNIKTVDRMVARGQIPFFRAGADKRFDVGEVEAALRKQ